MGGYSQMLKSRLAAEVRNVHFVATVGQSPSVAHAMYVVTPSPGQRALSWQLTVPMLFSNLTQHLWPVGQSVGTKQAKASEPPSTPGGSGSRASALAVPSLLAIASRLDESLLQPVTANATAQIAQTACQLGRTTGPVCPFRKRRRVTSATASRAGSFSCPGHRFQ